MFDFAWSEIMIIAVVALVVIGPKDLPKALKTMGFFVRRARSMAREFQSSVDEMIRESELDELRKAMPKPGAADFNRKIMDALDPAQEIQSAFEAPKPVPPIPVPPIPVHQPVEPPAETMITPPQPTPPAP